MHDADRHTEKPAPHRRDEPKPLGFMLPLFIGGCAFVIDQVSKYLIVNFVMMPPDVIQVTSFFNIVLVYNPGISFGMMSDLVGSMPQVFAGLKILIVVGLLVWAYRAELFVERLALCVMAGGALGNISDRFFSGAVTDFLDFHWSGNHWPAFNFADVAVFSGAFMLIVFSSVANRKAVTET